MNIVEPFLYQARYSGHLAALCVPGVHGGLVSHGRLVRLMNNVARKAAQIGFAPGQVAAIFVNHPILHTAIILGLARIGVVTFSGRNPNLPRSLRVDALITDSFFPYQAARVIRADAGWTEGDGTPPAPDKLHRSKPDDLCRIVLTSGTTGDAKAVGLTHAMLLQRIGRHHTVFGDRLPLCARTYCDMGFATSLGFQFLIYLLWRGGTMVVPGTEFEAMPRAFESYQIQNMVTSPAGLAQFLRHYEEHPQDRCGLETIMTGGSLLSPALAARTRARMCSHVVAAYGATETSMVAAASSQALADVPGAVGYVMPGMSVEIVGQGDAPLARGEEGIVRVRGPYSVQGYLDDPGGSRDQFRGSWFYPGDVGRLADDGLLAISGRETAVINLGGDKVKPELVEEIIKSFPGMEEAGVFSVTNELGLEEIWSLIVPRAQWDERALRAHCETKLPANFIPSRFIAVEFMPRNAMGKIERRALPEFARSKLI